MIHRLCKKQKTKEIFFKDEEKQDDDEEEWIQAEERVEKDGIDFGGRYRKNKCKEEKRVAKMYTDVKRRDGQSGVVEDYKMLR